MKAISAYFIGLIFGIGIIISGMANPAKVANFFDIAGSWDPSLAFVMGGALTIAMIGYRLVLARPAPMMASTFKVPTSQSIDARLIGGSALFGLGWGIAGFCPGGAIPALGTGAVEIAVFVAAMVSGIAIAKFLPRLISDAVTKAKSA